VQNDGMTDHYMPSIKRFIDTRFATGSGSGNWSTNTVGLVQEMAKAENGGIELSLPPVTALNAMRDVLKQQMQYNTLLNVSVFNEPSFYVYPNCRNLIHSLTNHRLEEDSEKEDERFKDFSDALRIWRAGISELRYIDKKNNVDAEYSEEYTTSSWMGV
jgi:hypothetical protein